VDACGDPCQGACTGRGHLETVASGTAADRRAQRLWSGDAGAERLVEAAKAGDEAARRELAEIGRLLGAGIGSFVNMFGPEVVVLGGGFGIGAGELLLEPALEVARREALAPSGDALRVVEAELGEEAGLVGAGLLAAELV
jgi:glucokinase